MNAEKRLPALALCMIVRNESAVVLRCLESVRALVDYVLVEDTGSTDGTQQLIRDWLRQQHIPGEVIDEPWRDFAWNRSHVAERLRARGEIDYALMIDADSRLVFEGAGDVPAFKASLIHDVYDLEIRHGGARFQRAQLWSNRLPFRFRGILHEYLEPPADATRAAAHGLHIVDFSWNHSPGEFSSAAYLCRHGRGHG